MALKNKMWFDWFWKCFWEDKRSWHRRI